jgi:hypothetical protein
MKVKTKDLSGAALDYAVATCEGLPLRLDPMGFRRDAPKSSQAGWWVWDEKPGVLKMVTQLVGKDYSPSTNWAQGGPIIEIKRIDVISDPNGSAGWMGRNYVDWREVQRFGATPLEAAMRCYVSATYGEELDIPDELMEKA